MLVCDWADLPPHLFKLSQGQAHGTLPIEERPVRPSLWAGPWTPYWLTWRVSGAGYSGKVAEEIDMLRRLARKGEDRQRLGRLMEVVSDKTASAVATAPKHAKARHAHQPLCLCKPAAALA